MVCFGNMCMDNLHKGDNNYDDGDNNNNNNNNNTLYNQRNIMKGPTDNKCRMCY